MPHRDPLLAAVIRIAHLREQLGGDAPGASSPRTLHEAHAEIARLERRIASRSDPEDDSDPEVGVFSVDEAAGEPDYRAAPDIARTISPVRYVLGVGATAIVVGGATVIGVALRDDARTPAAVDRATEVRLSGMVVNREGSLAVTPGEHCALTITDSGPGESRVCRATIACPHVTERFEMGGWCLVRGGRVRVVMGNLDVDGERGVVRFAAGRDGELGTARLALDAL